MVNSMRPVAVTLTVAAGATMLVGGWRAGAQPVTLDLALAQPADASSGSPADAAGTAGPSPDGSSLPGTAASPPAAPSASASPMAQGEQPSGDAALAAPAETAPPPAPEPAGPSGTFVGPQVDTRYGVMQVQVVLDNGSIAAVQPLLVGRGDGESVRINSRAVPVLQERVLAAQTWDVDGVSGASYTSQGILASAKGALADAGL